MTDIDIDDVLNLEEEQYQLGYKEGQEQDTKEHYIEGKEYGYQAGFQRFLIIGYVQGLIEHWLHSDLPESTTKHVHQLQELVSAIRLTNGDEEVEIYDKNIKKIKNKLRVIASLTKESWKVDSLDDLVKEIGGQIQASEGAENMW